MRTGFRTAPLSPSSPLIHTYVLKCPSLVSTNDWRQQSQLQNGATNVKTRRENAYRCRGTWPAVASSVCLQVSRCRRVPIYKHLGFQQTLSWPKPCQCRVYVLLCLDRLWTRYLGPWLGSPHIHDPSLLSRLSRGNPLPCSLAVRSTVALRFLVSILLPCVGNGRAKCRERASMHACMAVADQSRHGYLGPLKSSTGPSWLDRELRVAAVCLCFPRLLLLLL